MTSVFAKPADGLGECVVVAVVDTADRGLNLGFMQPFCIFNGYIVGAAVAMVDQAAAMLMPPFMQSLLQRVQHKPMRCALCG